MNVKILVSLFVLAAAGCASMQTEIIRDPGAIDSITVGRFTTRNPVDDELIGSYLRKELARQGFRVVDDSPYTLSGAIDVHPFYFYITEAKIVLNEERFVIWFYEHRFGWIKGRKDFARYMAKEIAETISQ